MQRNFSLQSGYELAAISNEEAFLSSFEASYWRGKRIFSSRFKAAVATNLILRLQFYKIIMKFTKQLSSVFAV